MTLSLGGMSSPAFAESAPPPTPASPNEASDLSFETSLDLALSVFLIVGAVGALYVFVENRRRERLRVAAESSVPAARVQRHRRTSTRPPARPSSPRVTAAQVEASTNDRRLRGGPPDRLE
jgi:hypothetical protein